MKPRDLNRRLLWSQCLSTKRKGLDAPVEVAEACCGIQSQDLQQSLSAFWARIHGFKNQDVLNQLRPGGGLVRTWAVRGAMHTIPSRDYFLYIKGGASVRMLKWIDTLARKADYPSRDQRRKWLYDPLLEEIQGRAVTKEELGEFVDERARQHGLKEGEWTGLGEMAFLGLLVHAGKKGSKSLWMRTDEWVSGSKDPRDRAACRAELLQKYIAQYGPVTKEDIRYWAYLTKKQLDEALALLGDELIQVERDDATEPYLALQLEFDKDLPPPPKVILLPKYDSILLGLQDKSRFMDMAHYKRVFPRVPPGMVRPTVLVDGYVVATWGGTKRKRKISVEIQPFGSISRSDMKAVQEQFQEYAEYLELEAEVGWASAT
ncbi:MAG: winged helix DNA-binding domain-containing protein [Thermoplasmata archaeon]